MSAEFEELARAEEDIEWGRSQRRVIGVLPRYHFPIARLAAAVAVLLLAVAAVVTVAVKVGHEQTALARKADLTARLQASSQHQSASESDMHKVAPLQGRAVAAAKLAVTKANTAADYFAHAAKAERAEAEAAAKEEGAAEKAHAANTAGQAAEWVHDVHVEKDLAHERKQLSIVAWKLANKAKHADAMRVGASKKSMHALSDLSNAADASEIHVEHPQPARNTGLDSSKSEDANGHALAHNGYDVEVVRKLLLECKHCHG